MPVVLAPAVVAVVAVAGCTSAVGGDPVGLTRPGPAVSSGAAVSSGPTVSTASGAAGSGSTSGAASGAGSAGSPVSPGSGPEIPGPATGPGPLPAPSGTGDGYREAIREHLMIPTTLDSDSDGAPDRMSVDLIRPKAPAGTKVPVILDVSPYYFTEGRGAESQLKRPDAKGFVQNLPLFYDEYFVPRGYAVVQMDNPGTGRSGGCMDVLGPTDVAAATQVVQALARAEWSNGKVALVGKSYDGSIANYVAAQGIPEVAAVVPISAISSAFDYAHPGGTVYAADWVRGYAEQEESSTAKRACADVNRKLGAAELASLRVPAGERFAPGAGSDFWRQRDIRELARTRWRAPALFVHGLHDRNVWPSQTTQLYRALADRGVPTQLWLTRAAHVDPFDVDRQSWIPAVASWLDHYLLGRGPAPAVGTVKIQGADYRGWRTETRWPAEQARPQRQPLSAVKDFGAAPSGGLRFTDADSGYWDADALLPGLTAEPGSGAGSGSGSGAGSGAGSGSAPADHAVLWAAPLRRPLRLSGAGSATLTLQLAGVDRAAVAVTLVDVGPASRAVLSRQFPENDGYRLDPQQDCYGTAGSGTGREGADPTGQARTSTDGPSTGGPSTSPSGADTGAGPSDAASSGADPGTDRPDPASCFKKAVPNLQQTGAGVIAQGWIDTAAPSATAPSGSQQPGSARSGPARPGDPALPGDGGPPRPGAGPGTLTVQLSPVDQTIPAGHRLAVLVAANAEPLRPTRAEQRLGLGGYTLDAAGSTLTLPVVP